MLGAHLVVLAFAACAPVHGPRGAYINFIRPDQHPPLVGAGGAADSLWGRAAESALGDGIAEGRRAELERIVRRFAPTIVLPPGDQVRVGDRHYRLTPIDAAVYADTLRLDIVSTSPYRYTGAVDIPLRSLTLDSLRGLVRASQRYESEADVLAAWYFDFPGGNPREWWKEYARLRAGPDSARWAQPTVYAHPFTDHLSRFVIQYWYFYPFNDAVGNHEGDWEHVNVILTPGRDAIAGIDYFFHTRTVTLPQGKYRPEIVDSTHAILHVGGRMYTVTDYPIRILAGDHNEGSHGHYPYVGEWEAAAGLGAPESIRSIGRDSTRVIPYGRFDVVLTPEPSRIDYEHHPEVLRRWGWLLLPARWGFPSVPSLMSELKVIDVGNRAPFGAPFNTAWNRTAPTLLYPGYYVRKLSFARSAIEDLLQPWYYLYIFRHPRYVHDTRGAMNRKELQRLGLAPRGGWAERGIGAPLAGVHLGIPDGSLSSLYANSTGISLWRNFWVKMRFGAIEVMGGYQRFNRTAGQGGSLFIFPITANVVVRSPDALFRPYVTVGGGLYGWDARTVTSPGVREIVTAGHLGWTSGAGIEYYLRPRMAFDVSVRYHATTGPGPLIGLPDKRLRFWGVWIGHYVRF